MTFIGHWTGFRIIRRPEISRIIRRAWPDANGIPDLLKAVHFDLKAWINPGHVVLFRQRAEKEKITPWFSSCYLHIV
jgi:hypothetical protein